MVIGRELNINNSCRLSWTRQDSPSLHVVPEIFALKGAGKLRQSWDNTGELCAMVEGKVTVFHFSTISKVPADKVVLMQRKDGGAKILISLIGASAWMDRLWCPKGQGL